MKRRELRRWLASGDAAPARGARWLFRSTKQLGAVLRSGSVGAEMDRIVERANDPAVGSSLSARAALRQRRDVRGMRPS